MCGKDEPLPFFCGGERGRDSSGFFFTLSSLLTLIEKRGACDPSPPPGAGFFSMTLAQSLQPLRIPQWDWEREGLGLTFLAGSLQGVSPARWLCVDNSARGLLGAAALILQAWGSAFECAGVLAPGRVGPYSQPIPCLGHEPKLRRLC